MMHKDFILLASFLAENKKELAVYLQKSQNEYPEAGELIDSFSNFIEACYDTKDFYLEENA